MVNEVVAHVVQSAQQEAEEEEMASMHEILEKPDIDYQWSIKVSCTLLTGSW